MKRFLILFLLISVSLSVLTDETSLLIPPFQHSLGYHKANSSIAKLVLGRKVDFHRTNGIAALKLKMLDDKTTNADDAILSLFGINNHQLVYNVGLTKLQIYGGKGRGADPESLFFPTDISVDENGNIYLTDTYNFRILKLKYGENDSLSFVMQKGGMGIDSASFNLPQGIDTDGDGNVYVCDTGNNRIIVMDSTLKTIMIFENIVKPRSISVVDSKKKYLNIKDAKFIIVSSDRRKLYKLGLHGQVLKEVFEQDLAEFKNIDFNYMDYDFNGNIWVTDTINSTIHKFDFDLKYVTSFGREGSGKNQFIKPEGISIYRKFGQVFIAEKTGFQYYWIGIDGYIREFTPSVLSDSTEGLTISLFTTEQCKATIEIMKNGKRIKKLTQNLKWSIGLTYIVWDLKDEDGVRITEKGKYSIKVTLEALYSSRGFFKKEFESDIEKI